MIQPLTLFNRILSDFFARFLDNVNELTINYIKLKLFLSKEVFLIELEEKRQYKICQKDVKRNLLIPLNIKHLKSTWIKTNF